MDSWVKRFKVPKKDEHGNVVYDEDGETVMVQSIISRS